MYAYTFTIELPFLHYDKRVLLQFQSLTSILFQERNDMSVDTSNPNTSNDILSDLAAGMTQQQCTKSRNIHNLRIELYDKLAEFFPESLAQPRTNLIDLLPL